MDVQSVSAGHDFLKTNFLQDRSDGTAVKHCQHDVIRRAGPMDEGLLQREHWSSAQNEH
jgi:hypothetical protein